MKGNRELGDALGAFVNVLAWAKSPTEFKKRVREAMAYYKYHVVSIRDVGAHRGDKTKEGEEFEELARDVYENRSHVRHSTFHSYDEK